jgi:hypothetical protein
MVHPFLSKGRPREVERKAYATTPCNIKPQVIEIKRLAARKILVFDSFVASG